MSYLIDQEAWLAFGAERLQVDPANLGERDIRLLLALYHAAYLPTAATVELRLNELDQRQRYAEFGFIPNTPSFATAKVRVTLPNPGSSYSLSAPFIVRQGDLAFIATSPLVIAAGTGVGEASIIAQLQGADGTPAEAPAIITASVGWLRGATIRITEVSPGRDGDTTDIIRSEFRAYAFNPQALVRGDDHADWVASNYDIVGRATAFARTRVLYNGSTYAKTTPIAGHMTLVLIGQDGGPPLPPQVAAIKDALMLVSIPYGADALHVIPGAPVNIGGSINATIEPGLDEDEIKTAITDALAEHLSWRRWPSGRSVYAGDLWGVVTNVSGVNHVTGLTVNGGSQVILEPWQHPNSSYSPGSITLVTA